MKILVLGLGNDIIADDAVGLEAARGVRKLTPSEVDVIETSMSGVALLEEFVGYDRAIIIDAVKTGSSPPGSIHEWRAEDLDRVLAPSPHFAGLPEMMALARELELEYPSEFRIIAMETLDPYTIGGPMSQPVRDALPSFIEYVVQRVNAWLAGSEPAGVK